MTKCLNTFYSLSRSHWPFRTLLQCVFQHVETLLANNGPLPFFFFVLMSTLSSFRFYVGGCHHSPLERLPKWFTTAKMMVLQALGVGHASSNTPHMWGASVPPHFEPRM